MIIITLKFTPSEQYVDWGNNINYVSMRDQHLPPPMNNMLVGVNNINFIFIRDQNLPPPYEQYVDLGNSINFIFITQDQT